MVIFEKPNMSLSKIDCSEDISRIFKDTLNYLDEKNTPSIA